MKKTRVSNSSTKKSPNRALSRRYGSQDKLPLKLESFGGKKKLIEEINTRLETSKKIASPKAPRKGKQYMSFRAVVPDFVKGGLVRKTGGATMQKEFKVLSGGGRDEIKKLVKSLGGSTRKTADRKTGGVFWTGGPDQKLFKTVGKKGDPLILPYKISGERIHTARLSQKMPTRKGGRELLPDVSWLK